MALKKILFLSAWYPTRIDPMPGLFVKRHAEILSDSFTIAALHAIPLNKKSNIHEIEKTEENQVFNIIIYYPITKSKIPIILHLIKLIRFIKAYQMGLKEVHKYFGLPDLIHVNILTRVGIIAYYLKIRYGVPYVITEHWTRYTNERMAFKGFFRKVFTRLIVKNSSGISSVSENLKRAMQNYRIDHRNFLIVHNIVDCNIFRPKDQQSNDIRKIFSHISCFDNRAKNTNGIVRAIASLSKRRTDFICLMVGDGPDKQEAEKLANQFGIKDKTIIFTGLKEGNDLVEIYNQSLFTFLFSNYENMPVVISESFACGRPVISTNVGGIPEIVNKSNGLLISPGNEPELESAINYMLDHSKQFDSSEIRAFAVDQFGKEAVVNQLMKLYQTVPQ